MAKIFLTSLQSNSKPMNSIDWPLHIPISHKNNFLYLQNALQQLCTAESIINEEHAIMSPIKSAELCMILRSRQILPNENVLINLKFEYNCLILLHTSRRNKITVTTNKKNYTFHSTGLCFQFCSCSYS